MTFLECAEEVLSKCDIPLSPKEIWEKGCELGLDTEVASKAKKPSEHLEIALSTAAKKNSIVFRTGIQKPYKYFLSARKHELGEEWYYSNDTKSNPVENTISSSYSECAMHSFLSYFVFNNKSFNRGKKVITKTIPHKRSLKKGFSKWLHPDIVGFYLPIEDWEENILKFNKSSENNAFQLTSFELKKEINKNNYKESFFQALSNSSWAHQGYLVASTIIEDKDLLEELSRLSDSFGIGIIQLNMSDIDSSKVLFPAKSKNNLDWETMNKLCRENPEFSNFIAHISYAYECRHKFDAISSWFDEILTEKEMKALSKKITGTTHI